MFDIGRLCVKTAGREAGRYCVILKKAEEGFVLITGPKELTKVRRRKCNVTHLEPLLEKLKISSDASDVEVLKAFEAANLFTKLKLKKLSKEELKALEAKKEEKAKKKEEIEKRKAEEKAKAEKEAAKKKEEKKPKPKPEKPKPKPEVKKEEPKPKEGSKPKEGPKKEEK